MASCSLLDFGGFLSSASCPLGGIGFGEVSHIFGLFFPSVFFPSMGCGGRWNFLPSSHPSLFLYLIYMMRRRTLKYLYLL